MNDYHAYMFLSLYLRNVDIVLYWFLHGDMRPNTNSTQYTRIRRWHPICCNVSNAVRSIFSTLSNTSSTDFRLFFHTRNYQLCYVFEKVLSVTAMPCSSMSEKKRMKYQSFEHKNSAGWHLRTKTEAIYLTKWMTNSLQWRRHPIVSLIECIIRFLFHK